jgi:hypothetical protein
LLGKCHLIRRDYNAANVGIRMAESEGCGLRGAMKSTGEQEQAEFAAGLCTQEHLEPIGTVPAVVIVHALSDDYGFRTYRVLELALCHSLGKLPEPESTHDFF